LAFRDLYDQYTALGVAIVGASFDTQELNLKFATDNGFQYPLICDTDKVMGLAYGACTDASAKYPKRIACVINGEGNVAHYFGTVSASDFPGDLLGKLS
jgi:peroxiredoxin Q/BCP